tara:strand:- start:140 stop:391 length:252 start_codon:yes stop_codon:yes gene_type:complete
MEKYNTKLLNKYLQQELKTSGMGIQNTKAKFAIEAGVSVSMINQLVAGTYKGKLSLSNARKLAKVLNVTLEEFVLVDDSTSAA